MTRLKSLTPKELKFCYNFLGPGEFCAVKAAMSIGYNYNTATKSAYKILQRPLVKEFIKQKLAMMESEAKRSRQEKLDKLWEMIDICTSDKMKENIIQSNDSELVNIGLKAFAIAGKSIAETNKMEGHYAVTETMSLNINADAEEAKLQKLLEDQKRDY